MPPFSKRFHLTGKPVELTDHLMNILPANAKILDPFAGSGTTLIAAKKRSITATSIELSEEYFNITKTRIAPSLIS